MAKRNRSPKRVKRRGKTQTSTQPKPAVPKRGRSWIIGAVVVLIVIAGIWGWTTRNRPGAADRSSTAPPATRRDHVTAMLQALTKEMPETVAEVQAEELALTEALVQAFPKSDVSLALKATVYLSRGDTIQAQALWEQAIDLNPKRSDLYKKIGEVAQGKDQVDKAIQWWQRGLKANPKAAGLRWNIANAMVTQGRLEGTLDLLEAECRISPRSPRNHYLIGQVHFKQGAYDQAVAAYRQALDINPRYYNAYYSLGMAHTRLKQPAEARAAITEFRRLKAESDRTEENQIVIDEAPRARRRLAALYGQAYGLYNAQKQAGPGEKLLTRALEMDPQNALLWEKMAGSHYSLGHHARAIKCFEEAEKLAPNKTIYPVNIAKLYAQTNQPKQARTALQNAVRRFPNASLPRVELARLYLESRTQYGEALTLMQKAVSLSPTANHYFLLTWAYDVNGDAKNALAAIQKAMALDPQNPKYRSTYDRIRSRR